MTATTSLTPAEINADGWRKAYDAFAAGDMGYFQRFFAPGIAWHVPGRNPLAGTKRGPDGVIEYFGELMARTDGTFHGEVLDVMATDTSAVGIHIDIAQRGTRTLHAPIVLYAKMSNGQVTECWEHYHDQNVVDAFFS